MWSHYSDTMEFYVKQNFAPKKKRKQKALSPIDRLSHSSSARNDDDFSPLTYLYSTVYKTFLSCEMREKMNR